MKKMAKKWNWKKNEQNLLRNPIDLLIYRIQRASATIAVCKIMKDHIKNK